MNKIEFKQITPQYYIDNIDSIILSGETSIGYYMILEEPFVHIGADACNTQYIKRHNILSKKLSREGGTIVGSPGDLEIIYFLDKNNFKGIIPEITYLIDIVGKKINNKVAINGNDILIDGYKVGSFVITEVAEFYFIAIVLSMTVNLNYIEHICKKPMIKIPKGLTEFGITLDDLPNILKLHS